jgi:sugar fermentation stimulation protein A
LEEGIFLKRYKRFMMDVETAEGKVLTLHCPNSGSLKSCLIPGAPIYYRDSLNIERKYPHTLELMRFHDGLACLNTNRSNHLMKSFLSQVIDGNKDLDFKSEAYKSQAPDFWQDYDHVISEAKYHDHTRFDFCLSSSSQAKKCWIEVKSVTYLHEEGYVFPDAVTTRGLKHIEDLLDALSKGDDAYLVFVIMRGSLNPVSYFEDKFRACHEIDPKYAKSLKKGLKVLLVIPSIGLEGFGIRALYDYHL